MSTNLVPVGKSEIEIVAPLNINLFEERFQYIREDMLNSPYIEETRRVLPVGGFRSAIGSFWNAVVDDLRNKITFRSLSLFNKEMKPSRQITKYEDFQDYVNDEMLIEGAYKIGVIGWEAHKMLKQAKETRHVFDGHPRSSNPSPLKALAMIEDCIKYVLSQEYPPQIVDIDEYLNAMGSNDFDRNEYSISDAICELPDVYKNELINRLFTAYVNDSCSSILRSNIEVAAPILWRVLPKNMMIQVCQRVDQEIGKGILSSTEYAFSFVNTVGAKKYLSTRARKYWLAPIIEHLNDHVDEFAIENECIDKLSRFAGYVPRELISDYVNGMVQTYVGHIGGSAYFARTDFYANGAAVKIPKMFEQFDDESALAFVECIKNNEILRGRIKSNVKLNRMRTLGEIVNRRVSENFSEKDFIDMLLDEKREKELFRLLRI